MEEKVPIPNPTTSAAALLQAWEIMTGVDATWAVGCGVLCAGGCIFTMIVTRSMSLFVFLVMQVFQKES